MTTINKFAKEIDHCEYVNMMTNNDEGDNLVIWLYLKKV